MKTLIKITVLLLGLQFSISPALAQLEDAKKKEIADQLSLCAAKVALLHELMRRQGQDRPGSPHFPNRWRKNTTCMVQP